MQCWACFAEGPFPTSPFPAECQCLLTVSLESHVDIWRYVFAELFWMIWCVAGLVLRKWFWVIELCNWSGTFLQVQFNYRSEISKWNEGMAIFNEGSAFRDIFVLFSFNDMTQWPAQIVAQHELWLRTKIQFKKGLKWFFDLHPVIDSRGGGFFTFFFFPWLISKYMHLCHETQFLNGILLLNELLEMASWPVMYFWKNNVLFYNLCFWCLSCDINKTVFLQCWFLLQECSK